MLALHFEALALLVKDAEHFKIFHTQNCDTTYDANMNAFNVEFRERARNVEK